MATKTATKATLTIPAPKFETVAFKLVGTAPYVQNKFSQEARDMMKAKQEAGSQANKGRKKDPKDFEKAYKGAMHCFPDGGWGVPASTFRQAMVSACRLVGFKMTIAKLAVFIEADGVDADDASPLVRITKGTPHRVDSYVRNETGVADIRPRPVFDAGWEAILRVKFDADLFTAADVKNLLTRVGVQVGVGAGRPDSKTSCGQGWGTFDVEEAA